MKLDLPGRVPLPDDVRHRALNSVLAGLDEVPARRWPGRELLAAAVAAALVIGIVAAAALNGQGRAGPELVLPAAPPPPVVEPIDRCRAAVPEGAGYPPVEEWRVTWVYNLGVDQVHVIDDRFACLLSPQAVTVSPLAGAPVGGASLVRLAPAVVAVLNPDELPVSVSGEASARDWDDPGVIVVTTDEWLGEDYRIVVGDTYDGPPPPDLPTGQRVVDQPLPSRVYDESDPDVMNLEACLPQLQPSENSEPDLWLPAFTITDPEPPVLVARIAGRFAGLCVLAPDGPPLFATGELLPGRETDGQIVAITSSTVPRGEPSDGVPLRVLVAVPPDTVRVESTAVDGAGARVGTLCDQQGDLALCQLPAAAEGNVEVTAFYGTEGRGRVITG